MNNVILVFEVKNYLEKLGNPQIVNYITHTETKKILKYLGYDVSLETAIQVTDTLNKGKNNE